MVEKTTTFSSKQFCEEVPKLATNIVKKTGAIILMGGLIYSMPKTFTYILLQHGPIVFILGLRAIGQTIYNVGEIAVDSCKLVGLIGQGVFYSLWWVGESLVAVVSGEENKEKVIEQISEDLQLEIDDEWVAINLISQETDKGEQEESKEEEVKQAQEIQIPEDAQQIQIQEVNDDDEIEIDVDRIEDLFTCPITMMPI